MLSNNFIKGKRGFIKSASVLAYIGESGITNDPVRVRYDGSEEFSIISEKVSTKKYKNLSQIIRDYPLLTDNN